MKEHAFDPEEELRLATFAVGDDLYAIDIMRIREIVRPLGITPVPKAPAGMVGVIDLRGQVLPLFDLRLRFDLPPRLAEDLVHVRHLIISLDGRVLGIVVDQVHDVVNVTRSQLRTGVGVLAGEAAEVFIGVCPVTTSYGDRLALLLNLRRILAGAHSIPVGDLLRGTNKTLLPAPVTPPSLGALGAMQHSHAQHSQHAHAQPGTAVATGAGTGTGIGIGKGRGAGGGGRS